MKKIQFHHSDGIKLGHKQAKLEAKPHLVENILITNIKSTLRWSSNEIFYLKSSIA